MSKWIVSLTLLLGLALAPSPAAAAPGNGQLLGTKIKNGSGTLNIPSSGTVTVPAVTDTLVGRATTDAITNKDIDGGTASNSSRVTLPKASTSTLTGLTRKQGTVAYDTTLNKAVIDNGTNLVPVGSGSGAGGVNFLVLDSSHQPNNPDQADFEGASIGWTAYADAAGVLPVDATGGSPTVTCTRTTTKTPTNEVGNGAGALKITKDAANRQGEGCSLLVYIPPQYRGKVLTFLAPTLLISGSWVQGDVVLAAYDVTNSVLLTGTAKQYMLSAKPQTQYTFTTSDTTAQIRFSFHIATTSTAALSFGVDDLKVDPNSYVTGMAGSNWRDNSAAYTVNGLGTLTNYKIFDRRVGDSVEIKGSFTSGTHTASPAYIQIPYTIDTTKITSATNLYVFGVVQEHNPGGSSSSIFSNSWAGVGFYDGSTTNQIFLGVAVQNSQINKVNGSSTGTGNGTGFSFNFTVPVAGYDANVTMGESSTYLLSSVLATGTRVTSTPTKLGEYRALLKTVSAVTFTTDTTPTDVPSVASGMHVYSADGTSAGTSGQPNRYLFYVPPGMKWRMLTYASANRSGGLNTQYFTEASSFEYGLDTVYDPVTSVLTVSIPALGGSVTNRYIGKTYSSDTAASGSVKNGYFDIELSSNPQFVGIDNRNVSSGAANERVERFTVGCLTSVCSSTPCTIESQSGSWLGASSVTRSGTGRYAFAPNSGVFSGIPTCTVQACAGGSGRLYSGGACTSSTSCSLSFDNSSNAATDAGFQVVCMGPR